MLVDLQRMSWNFSNERMFWGGSGNAEDSEVDCKGGACRVPRGYTDGFGRICSGWCGKGFSTWSHKAISLYLLLQGIGVAIVQLSSDRINRIYMIFSYPVDRFKYRTRYFTDSGIIGTKAFVTRLYQTFKDHFSSKHEKRPKVIKGLDGIYSMKRLSERIWSIFLLFRGDNH